MRTNPSGQRVLPTILDRLTADARGVETGGGQTLGALRDSVRRDLEALLNTRQRSRSWPKDLDELDRSLFNFGIPEFSGTNMGSKQRRELFRREVEEAIRRAEPRFKSISVEILEHGDELDRRLRFRIDALIHAEPAPEHLLFDSILEPVTQNFRVVSQRDA